MAISLTKDGLNLDYKTEVQQSVSGTYPVGTVIAFYASTTLSFPGTWTSVSNVVGLSRMSYNVGTLVTIGSGNYINGLAIRIA